MALYRALLIVFISSLFVLSSSVDAQEAAFAPVSLSISEAIQTAPVAQVVNNAAAGVAVNNAHPVDVKTTVNKIEKNMMMTMQKTDELLKVIKKRLAATPGESPAEECLKTCIEVYENAIDDIKNCIEDLESGNYFKVNVDISAVATDIDTCEECYVEMLGEDPELKKFDEWVRGVTGECLSDLETVSPHH